MAIQIRPVNGKFAGWDDYVKRHPRGTLYHLAGWKQIIEQTYGHDTYYLAAFQDGQASDLEVAGKRLNSAGFPGGQRSGLTAGGSRPDVRPAAGCRRESVSSFVGVLPLIHIRHFFFGNTLLSVPFCDYGGILADAEDVEHALLTAAIQIAYQTGADSIELRNIQPLRSFRNAAELNDGENAYTVPILIFENEQATDRAVAINSRTRTRKVRMLLELPDTAEDLMQSFKSKLRSQVRKPMKAGLTYTVGGQELLNDFYQVFASNMRDLGSPVHAKELVAAVLSRFEDTARIVAVYQEKKPLACSVIIGFGEILENPWASSLRRYSKLAPNMLLYWAMLEYACENGYTYFDFGRSSVDEGTYRFKQQWGAEPVPLHWQYLHIGKRKTEQPIAENGKYGRVSRMWAKLPVSVTKVFGPPIRKYIGL